MWNSDPNHKKLTENLDDRNQLNMGLFNITLPDAEFYALAEEGSIVNIDRISRTVHIEGTDKHFQYHQSEMEKTLLNAGGVLPLYNKFGRSVFRQIARASTERVPTGGRNNSTKISNKGLEW